MQRVNTRTVAGILNVQPKGMIFGIRNSSTLPLHRYVFCKSRNIAIRFLSDAQKEGFTFGDGKNPTDKQYSDIYAIQPDFTISYVGWAGHVLFRNGGKNVIRVDYGKYISNTKDYLIEK